MCYNAFMNGDKIMPEMIEGRKIVLSSMVGSWASNLNTSTSDEDWKYFVCPTFDDLYTGKMFSTSSVTDTFDYDAHDIRQLINLLWKANLNFIVVLFGRDAECVPELDWVFKNADSLAIMNLPYFHNATMGMHFEKMSTLMKGTGNTQVLIDKFGYDTKQACHALRCLYVLERFYKGKSMREALWFENGFHRDILIDVKSGEMTLPEFRMYIESWHIEYKEKVKDFFSACLPSETLKEEAEARIKNFIRANI